MKSAANFPTAAVHLESYDNYDSVRDKLTQLLESGRCPTRVLLLWPVRGRVIKERSEFARLKYMLQHEGHQLAIVSTVPAVCYMAASHDIPVFSDRSNAENSFWHEVPRVPENTRLLSDAPATLREEISHAQPQPVPRGREVFFFILAFLCCFLLAYFLLPHAVVEIAPLYTRQYREFNLWSDDTVEGGVPIHTEHFTLDLSAEVPTTGMLQGQASLATGSIQLKNIYEKPRHRTAGLELLTEDGTLKFRTLDTAHAEPGQTLTLRVEALIPGTSGNLPADIPLFPASPESLYWEVIRTEALSGGSDGHYPSPCPADYQAAEDAIAAQVPDAALQALAELPRSGIMAIGEPEIVQITSEQMTPDYGYVSNTLRLQQTMEIALRVAEQQDIDRSVKYFMDAEGPVTKAGPISYTILSEPVSIDGRIHWRVGAERQVYEEKTNEEAVRSILQGKSLNEARTILDEISPDTPPQIQLWPTFLERMPIWKMNISVRIIPREED